MHVIANEEKFTLVGSDARHGKLTLFDAEGPREPGALKHVALRVSDLAAALRALPGEGTAADGDRARRGAAHPPRRGADRRRVRPRPRRAARLRPGGGARGVPRLGFAPADSTADGAPRVEVGGAYVELHAGDPGDAERPLLNHIAVLVDSARGAHRRGRGAGIGRERRRRAEHARRLPPRPRRACASSTSSTSRRSRSARPPCAGDSRRRHGRSRRGGAGARARGRGRRAREGRSAGRVDAALVVRRSGATGRSTSSARSAPAATPSCSGSWSSGSTTRSRGSSRSAPSPSGRRRGTRARSASASIRRS